MVNIYALKAVSSLSLSLFFLSKDSQEELLWSQEDKSEKRCKIHEDSDRIYEIWSNQECGLMDASSSHKAKKKETKKERK